ncbi:MAG: DUF4258 domain-containing protein [Sphingomonadales bacterium]
MECRTFRFSRHAIERMFGRGIAPALVEAVVRHGEVIATYPDDRPFPSALILGSDIEGAVHVVVAQDAAVGLCYIITVYRPDPGLWDKDFRTRRVP